MGIKKTTVRRVALFFTISVVQLAVVIDCIVLVKRFMLLMLRYFIIAVNRIDCVQYNPPFVVGE